MIDDDLTSQRKAVVDEDSSCALRYNVVGSERTAVCRELEILTASRSGERG